MSNEYKDWMTDRVQDYLIEIDKSKNVINNLIIAIDEFKKINDDRVLKIAIQNAHNYLEYIEDDYYQR